jgi:formylglycine-generating enzyme required for sulfatase activity
MSSRTRPIKNAAIDAIVETIEVESDPWRKARLLAFVRKERGHPRLRKVAQDLFANEEGLPPEHRQCYWAALELLTTPSADPPAEGPLWIEPVSGVCFVRVKPGRFLMGSTDGEPEERPVHEVEITREFWLARHAVTNGEYRRYLKADDGAREPERLRDPLFNQAGQPVVCVSWEEAENGYCKWLREETGHPFRLPTEAEWEYACRAGSAGRWCCGNDETELGKFAWYDEDLGEGLIHPVGLKRPNHWGLQDMHGNVSEWCWDWYGSYPAQSEPRRDPEGPPSGIDRVSRGGWMTVTARGCRSAARWRGSPVTHTLIKGFRPAMVPSRSRESAAPA